MIPVPRHRQLVLALTLTVSLDMTPPNGAVAAEPPTKETLAELQFLKEETVSIAARHEQPISEAPSNVYVITDEDIRQSGAPDLPTVLRRVPGIEVMQTTGAEFNVSARGDNQLNANKMLVLIDGRSIYEDVEGTVIWKNIQVTLPEIKRIEVLKGPASATYGFNAFDGVVNIITKSPEEMKGTTLQIGGGEFGTLTASAIEAGRYEKLGYRLSVGRDQNQAWRNRDELAFRNHKFNLYSEYQLTGQSKIFLSGGLADANRANIPVVGVVSGRSTIAQGYAQVGYEHGNLLFRSWWSELTASTQELSPSLSQFLRITAPDGNPTLTTIGNTYNIDGQHGFEIGSSNRLTYGVNYRHNTFSANWADAFSQEDRLGVFLQDEWRMTHELGLVGGVRYDLHSDIPPTISPRFALLYTPVPDNTFRISVSVGARPPTLVERHAAQLEFTTLPPPFPSPPPIIVRGSPSLLPEKIISYEAEYQGWFFRHRLRTRAALFFNHISDLISPTAFGSVITFANGGIADIYGGEAGIEFLAKSWLSGFANYSYEEVGQSFTGDAQRSAPRFKFNLGLRGDWDNGLNSEVALYHVGATTFPVSGAFAAFSPFGVVVPDPRVGSYNLLNLRIGYRFLHEKAEVAVSAFNALNDRHKENPVGDTIGSRVMGWLTIKF